MPVIARFCGIVIRLLSLRFFGTRLHAFHKDGELVVDLASLKIIDGNASEAVKELVMSWAKAHQDELMSGWWQAKTMDKVATANWCSPLVSE